MNDMIKKLLQIHWKILVEQIKHDIIYVCFESNYFCVILSGWVCASTIVEIIQFALQKIIQNKLQKLFNTNVIITL